MTPPPLRYRTFAEIADEMAKKHYSEWWRARRDDYLEALLSDLWSERFVDDAGESCLFCLYLTAKLAPEPVTREFVWHHIPKDYRPRVVRNVPEFGVLPCELLAAAKLEDYDRMTVHRLFEKLALSEADARAWMDRYDEENSPRVQFGTQNTPSVEPDPYRTGAPGRPSIMHLILAEFYRRANGNDTEVKPTLAAEARSLRDWAAEEHPKAPKPSAGTIENKIREAYHQYHSENPTK